MVTFSCLEQLEMLIMAQGRAACMLMMFQHMSKAPRPQPFAVLCSLVLPLPNLHYRCKSQCGEMSRGLCSHSDKLKVTSFHLFFRYYIYFDLPGGFCIAAVNCCLFQWCSHYRCCIKSRMFWGLCFYRCLHFGFLFFLFFLRTKPIEVYFLYFDST